jgi:hypothetical protein
MNTLLYFQKDCFFWIFHRNFLIELKKNIIFIEKQKFIKFSKNLRVKFFKIFKKKKTEFLENKIFGLKFKPFLFSREKLLKKKISYFKIYQQKNLEKRRNKNSHEITLFRRFHTSLYIKDKKIQTSFSRISNKKIFEETANDLRFFLDIDLIKNTISRSPILICFWLFCGTSWDKTKDFWFYYFSSCFYSMIRYHKQSINVEFKRKYDNFDFFKICNEKDSEFIYFREEKFDFKTKCSLTFPSKTLIEVETCEIKKNMVSKQQKFSYAWRNRFINKNLFNFFSKKIKINKGFCYQMFFG